jgi:hypothetical protein
LNFGELFEVKHQRQRNGVKRAIRLATTRKIHMRDTISEHKLAVTGKTVEDEGCALVALDIARTFEIFIEDGADQIL